MPVQLEQIYIDERVVDEPLTRRIVERTHGIAHDVIRENELEAQLDGISLTRGKRILYLTSQQGDLVKSCPGTLPPYLCCQYTIINQMVQCPMECTYCVLQDYLDNPFMTLHVNLSQIFDRINGLLVKEPHRFFRFGTGELSDSIVFDDVNGLSRDYGQFFSMKKNVLIEFKTKTKHVDQLLHVQQRHTVVSWSINPSQYWAV